MRKIISKKPRPKATKPKVSIMEKKAEFSELVSAIWKTKMPVKTPVGPTINHAFIRGGKSKQGKKKAVIAINFNVEGTTWLYYPTPEEAVRFGKGLQNVGQHSVTKHYPGSVGLIKTKQEGADLTISFMQGSFAHKKTEGLSSWATSKHGGWRQHLLKNIFEDAIKNNVKSVSFELPDPSKVTEKARQNQSKIFIEEASKFGFKRRIGREDLIILLR
jgi:hypothetical protein